MIGNSRRRNLSRLPGVGTNVERESVDSGGMGLVYVGEPVTLGIGICVPNHVVGDDNLGIAAILIRVCVSATEVVERTARHGLNKRGSNQTKDAKESGGVHR